jgi:hypothetical protein
VCSGRIPKTQSFDIPQVADCLVHLVTYLCSYMNRGSSQSKVTLRGLEEKDSISGRGKCFSPTTASRPVVRSIQSHRYERRPELETEN